MTIEQFISVITSVGAPGVLAMWLWTELTERRRLQHIVESFLPLLDGTTRVTKSIGRMVEKSTENMHE